jgi:hypothetical protein
MPFNTELTRALGIRGTFPPRQPCSHYTVHKLTRLQSPSCKAACNGSGTPNWLLPCPTPVVWE